MPATKPPPSPNDDEIENSTIESDIAPRSHCIPFSRAPSGNRSSRKDGLGEEAPSSMRKMLLRTKSSKVDDSLDGEGDENASRSLRKTFSRTQSSSRRSLKRETSEVDQALGPRTPKLLPKLDPSPWKPSGEGQHADLFSKKIGEFTISVLPPEKHCCNAVVALVVNSLKFQLLRLSRVVDVVRRYKQYLTSERVDAMYDWIEVLRKDRFLPLLASLRDDVLPELGKVSSIPESSLIHYERRAESFEHIANELNSVVESSDALTPRLPKGERVHVLIDAYFKFEFALLLLLRQVEDFAIPKRLPSPSIQRQLALLERHVFDIISFSAGSVEPGETAGSVGYNEELSQHMRGVLTAWMSRAEVDALRSRLGIRFYNIGGAKMLREARKTYRRTAEGRFVGDFIAEFVADVTSRNEGAGQMDHQILKQLNALNVRRLMNEVNGEDVDLNDVELEEVTGEVVDDSDDDDIEYLVFRNVYQPSPGSSPVSDNAESCE